MVNPSQGIWLSMWAIFSSLIAHFSKDKGDKKEWGKTSRRRGPFYILSVDAIILSCLIVEMCRHPINTSKHTWELYADLGRFMSIIMM